jgi:hypothetical protein
MAEEVASPATRTNDKATLFITCPFCCPCLYSEDVFSNDRYSAKFLQRRQRSLNLHEFFNFVNEQPSLKRRQMLTFYAFVGQLRSFLAGVAGKIHFLGSGGLPNLLAGLRFSPRAGLAGLAPCRRQAHISDSAYPGGAARVAERRNEHEGDG